MTSEMSITSLESTRASADRGMSLERKVIGYKTRAISEPIYEDKLVKSMTMEIYYEITNTNLNIVYIPIKVA